MHTRIAMKTGTMIAAEVGPLDALGTSENPVRSANIKREVLLTDYAVLS